MSQNYDSNRPEQDLPQGGPDNPLGHERGSPGAQNDTRPPRRGRKILLFAIVVIVLAAWTTRGGLIVSMNPTAASSASATSKTALSTSQIASRVDSGLADVVSTDSYQQATAAGTGIVLASTGEVLTNNHVVEGATSVKVTDIGNGKSYTATVIGYDATQDVAVLHLQGASGLTTASPGDSATVQTFRSTKPCPSLSGWSPVSRPLTSTSAPLPSSAWRSPRRTAAQLVDSARTTRAARRE